MSRNDGIHLFVAGRSLALRGGGLNEPLRAWLGAAATPATGWVAIGAPVRLDLAPVDLVPEELSVLHGEPLVEVRGDGDGRRWFSIPGADPAVSLDLRRRVIVCAPEAAGEPGRHLPLVALALLCALRATGLLPLHAGAVVLAGGAVLLVGPSGQGKSTAAARAAADGLEVIADDTVLIDGETVHGIGSGIRMRVPGQVERPVLAVPRHGPLPCRAVVVLHRPGEGGAEPGMTPEPRHDVYAALLAATPVAMDPDSLDATRAGLLQLARLPGFRMFPGSPDAPLRPALENALGAGHA
ncbi:MAG TPA: hypothetical protein VG266_06160 [Candidatus Dormibacteraeota bacterium]|nr:hypothetical protein [Candidatus Dormibacteraeota bacterium]